MIEYARLRGLLTTSDIANIGVSKRYLRDLLTSGHLERVGRGLYSAPSISEISLHRSKLAVAMQVPRGVICLLSALAFHEIGTQLPPAVWLAIPRDSWVPKFDMMTVEVVKMKPELLELDVEVHLIEGVPVRITSPVKTVVDCFKYRSRVGTDVALEALKDGISRRRFTSDQLYKIAIQERMWKIILPYAEVLSV